MKAGPDPGAVVCQLPSICPESPLSLHFSPDGCLHTGEYVLGEMHRLCLGRLLGFWQEEPWLCWCFQGVSHASSGCCSCPLRGQEGTFLLGFSLVGSGEESVLKKRVLAYDPDQYTLELALELRSDSHFGVACLSAVPAAHPPSLRPCVHLSPCWEAESREGLGSSCLPGGGLALVMWCLGWESAMQLFL